MCGRFALEKVPVALLLEFDLFPPRFIPRYNIAPTQDSLVVFQEYDESPMIESFRWGLVPPWAEDTSNAARAINARAETVDERRTFQAAFHMRRCLVPASGFYEWRSDGTKSGKFPYYFSPVEPEAFFALAGIWERWRKNGAEVRSFSIITTAANATVAAVHDRMPVILPRENWAEWINPKNKDRECLRSLLTPAPEGGMQCWRVGPYVNNPGNEDKRCIEPVG